MKILLALSITLLFSYTYGLNSVWRFECENGFCQKKRIIEGSEDAALSLAICRLTCSDAAALWPKPTGDVSVGKDLVDLNINNIDIKSPPSEVSDLIAAASTIFKEDVKKQLPSDVTPTPGKSLEITLDIKTPTVRNVALKLNESYTLTLSESGDVLSAQISADNFFGARHGLETLSQLIVFDDLRDVVKIPMQISISDEPAYGFRGISLDTSRNYQSIAAIKRTLDGMGASKLNSLHWHITDSHSFPFVSKTRPELTKLGAYSPSKVYRPAEIEDLIAYGKARGVRIMPEFDAPAHVGEGWQDTGLVTCFNWHPWEDYCQEPPCGQLDPTKSEVYNVLEDIYGDMMEVFKPDIFHMGGDEIHFNCWNSTPSIVDWMATEKGWGRTDEDFVKLWDLFQSQALERVYKKAGREIPVIMWTSHLTESEHLEEYLPKEKYIIQIWTTGDDPQIANLLEKGYNLILSNYDASYLDCGFSGWVTDGHNWCSPYVEWMKIYGNSPRNFTSASTKDQILGSEAVLWTEQVDSHAVDSRIWPRAAAMAEVLWSDPTTTWREAEHRFLVHRERLVTKGIHADGTEPEWCIQNEQNCPIGLVPQTESDSNQ